MTGNANTPETIKTAQTIAGVTAQIAENQVDLPAAVKAVQDAPSESQQGLFEANALLAINNLGQTTAAAATVAATSTTPSATSTATSKAKAGKKGKNGARAFVA